jgi:PST family polysaccharide transporter
MTSLESIATLGFQNGIVKYVAEIKEDKRFEKLLSTVCLAFVAVVLSVVLFLCYIWNQKYSERIINTNLFSRCYSLTLVRHLHLLIAVLNGLGSFKE